MLIHNLMYLVLFLVFVFLGRAAKLPNIVLFLTDDQDLALGGWTPMKQASSVLNDAGVTAKNWFIHTPVCCPSRAEILSGRYFHNLRMPDHKGGCMHINETKVNPNSFAYYLQTKANYNIGYFGKHMNKCPKTPPPGFDCPHCYWFTNGGGRDSEPGGYLNASFNDYIGGKPNPANKGSYKANTNGEFAGYTTSIIANKSIAWVKEVASLGPFMVTVAPKAPHVASTPAPWYLTGTWIDDLKAPRTPDYNASKADLADHHELIASQDIITLGQASEIDNLFRNRWRTLLSVDDAIMAMYDTLKDLDLLDSTYFLSTSDHGYNLGQHRLPSCKLNVYDHDIRIPMVIRGPGIKAGSTFDLPASNVDVAPTFLGLAGLDEYILGGIVPMDGKSIAALIIDPDDPHVPDSTREHVLRARVQKPLQWRDFHFVEYYSLGNVKRTGHLVDDTKSNSFRALRFVSESAKPLGGNTLYAEFTSLDDWNFTSPHIFVEMYDLDSDPYQLKNLANQTSAEDKQKLHQLLVQEWTCIGTNCL